jgi:hypothetical protein
MGYIDVVAIPALLRRRVIVMLAVVAGGCLAMGVLLGRLEGSSTQAGSALATAGWMCWLCFKLGVAGLILIGALAIITWEDRSRRTSR